MDRKRRVREPVGLARSRANIASERSENSARTAADGGDDIRFSARVWRSRVSEFRASSRWSLRRSQRGD